MPFLRSSTRPRAVECFFCLSASLLPPSGLVTNRKGKGRASAKSLETEWNWHCDRCGCWNIKDKNGHMVSDLPAMHNSNLNQQSFSLRARPSSSHLPSASASASPCCHSCLANQTLIMNMLANYLPDDSDPSFHALYAALPTYISNLHSRYPPVCPECQPSVEAALRKSDLKAQTEAWGSALQRGTGRHSATRQATYVGWLDVVVWRIKGVLFILGCAFSWGQGITSAARSLRMYEQTHYTGHSHFNHVVLAYHVCSALWMTWDPNWLSRSRHRLRTSSSGRRKWIICMFTILLLRIAGASSFLWSLKTPVDDTLRTICVSLEMAIFIYALSSLPAVGPVPLKLVRPVPVQVHSPTHNATPPPAIGSLSLSNDSIKVHNPVFGKSSFVTETEEDHVEMMDWEPVNTSGQTHDPDLTPMHERSAGDWDTFATGRQSMFPRQTEETGLESLLASWRISNSTDEGIHGDEAQAQKCVIA
ncbi:Ima1 N-terminal domain-domain-containing protein [Kockovaella imperatae]|uniref:Ima1 N-terminal domain-domain-containing protein n=1 Tax=Kockovaella imperatae TaxID=4999 RepID=A0A1Y1USZ8_9TREE|nr:Ima1 N-terminal domain-domain-containing protein [Kockovaella imperatae]ORX41072.1 Ima1 N-terminal domain-domain-containing protein [Kockovaella imperatae]